ncbi:MULTISPECIES: rhamnulokinase [Bacillus]|uniref:rhamnulokinase n=1 Tax=Bacillus TaxID=1386 RepID=UPI000309112B|nr:MULTISPECIES: rhamnulokinase family protein [Bacillus]
MKHVYAFDLGASNGRLIMSSFDGEKLYNEEIHRFTNFPIHKSNNLFWDFPGMIQELKNGMAKKIRNDSIEIESLGVDSWGVDFGLLSKEGHLLQNPMSYRDSQFINGMGGVLTNISKRDLFQRTGVETAPINTISQLYFMKLYHPHLLEDADALLLTPNLINYFFTGEKVNEFTITTTTQLYNFAEKNWDFQLLQKLNLPTKILTPITNSSTVLGNTLSHIHDDLGIRPIKVINVAGHDTASAVAALPIEKKNSVFMSCGTWTLIGVQVKDPIVTDLSFLWGFTNEGMIDGEFRLQKNNMGLWILQQCRKIWAKEGDTFSYTEENCILQNTTSINSLIDPDDFVFFNPENMVEEVQEYCRNRNQVVPEKKGEIIRCVLESLALKYRWIIEKLEQITGEQLYGIYMGGGGIQNEWLCQFTANATNRLVHTGPVEASAIGNGLSQWITLGEIKNLDEGREIVKKSFSTKIYVPEDQNDWQEKFYTFNKLLKERWEDE